MPQLVASPQHLSEILDTLPVGVGAGVPAEAARRQQVEVVAVKISSRTALQTTAQPGPSARERVGGMIGSITGGKNGRSQDTTADDLQGVGGSI